MCFPCHTRLQSAVLNKIAFKVALAGLMACIPGAVLALDDQWYLGIGGGISQLQPDTEDTSIDVDKKNGQVATVFIGRDFNNRSSGQFQLYSLDEAEYSDDQSNAGSATLTLVRRFAGRRRMPAALPPVAYKPTTPSTPTTTDAVETLEPLETVDSADSDVTRIAVQERAIAVPTDLPELDKLVLQLNDFPGTYIELVAHTDNTGSEAEQSELTRQRLRSIGVYLVRHYINQDRLLLRSCGGSRPVFDNSTTQGRRRNNRIEVFENP